MGNNAAKEEKKAMEYGGVYVQTDKQVYSPSDAVTGTINLNLIKQYPGLQLSLVLSGEVKARWIERQRKTRTRAGKVETYHVNVTLSGNRIVINQEVPILDGILVALFQQGNTLSHFPF